MDVYDAICSRKSIRSFTDQDVSEETVFRLLRAAVQAPSAGNVQPWRFYVVYQQDAKDDLANAALGQGFVAEAPVVVVVCADLGASGAGYGRRGTELYAIQDTAAAVENLLLAATGEGLGACWVGAFDEAACASALGLPSSTRPTAIIPIGHPRRVGRKPSKIDPRKLTEFR